MTQAPDWHLVGASGMLGRAFTAALQQRDRAYTAATSSELNLTDSDSIRLGVQESARMVINCAAWTDVDGAEAHEQQATQINGTGVGILAERCREVGATLVHFSTDYVFSGDARHPYLPDGPHNPVNAYGRSKAVGERLLWESGCDHLLVRTSWVYAPWGNNFPRTIARLSAQRDHLRVVDDQRGRPSSAEHLARTTLALLDAGARGTFHATDGGECTWFELARAVAAHVNPGCRVEPCTSDEFPRHAQRPAYSVLSLDKTESLIGPMTPWQENLEQVLARLEP